MESVSTSTVAVDLTCTDTQTVEYRADTVEVETCTTPEPPVEASETQTSVDMENVSTSTVPVDLVCIDTQTAVYKIDTVEAETSTLDADLAMAETQTAIDKEDILTADAETSYTPVDLVMSGTQTVESSVDTSTAEAEKCTTAVDISVVGIQTSLEKGNSSTAEAQTSTTPVDVVMVYTQTDWTDDRQNLAIQPLCIHSAVSVAPEVKHPYVDNVVGRDVDVEGASSSSESINLEDDASSEGTLFTDAKEDFESTLVHDSDLRTDSEEVGVDNISDDKLFHLPNAECTDASSENVNFQECDSHLIQSLGDVADHSSAPQVELFGPAEIPTLNPLIPNLVGMEQQPDDLDVGPAVLSTGSQVRAVAWLWCWWQHSFALSIACMLLCSA